MPHPHRPPPAATARGLAALLLLATAIIGVPVALLALGATPVPHHLPAPAELWQRLTRQDDGTRTRPARRRTTAPPPDPATHRPDLDAALNLLEAELLTRARHTTLGGQPHAAPTL